MLLRVLELMDFYAHFFNTSCLLSDLILKLLSNFFFETSLCLDKSNCAYVSFFIPKVNSLCAIKDFRPVACSSILYKIIFIVLSNRMQHVLDDIIVGRKSAFVKDRVIYDHVILIYELIKGMKGNTPSVLI